MKRVVQTRGGGVLAGSGNSSSGLSIWIFVILTLLMDDDHLFSDLLHFLMIVRSKCTTPPPTYPQFCIARGRKFSRKALGSSAYM